MSVLCMVGLETSPGLTVGLDLTGLIAVLVVACRSVDLVHPTVRGGAITLDPRGTLSLLRGQFSNTRSDTVCFKVGHNVQQLSVAVHKGSSVTRLVHFAGY